MTVRCSVSIDEEHSDLDLDFVEIPRSGEALEIAGADSVKTVRVTRVVHRVGSLGSPSVLIGHQQNSRVTEANRSLRRQME